MPSAMSSSPLPLSLWLFWALLAAVGIGRLLEMRLSRRNQRDLAHQGARRMPERGFGLMVGLHTGVLASAAMEAWLCERPFVPALAIPALLAVAFANALRWWVIRTLDRHWNVQVMDSLGLGVVAGGPYRFVRHPNYVAVFLELLALPLVHTAFLTAAAGTLLHVFVLARRIALEERVLLAHADYQAIFADRPRFIPRFTGRM